MDTRLDGNVEGWMVRRLLGQCVGGVFGQRSERLGGLMVRWRNGLKERLGAKFAWKGI